jgi:hypothetical protein
VGILSQLARSGTKRTQRPMRIPNIRLMLAYSPKLVKDLNGQDRMPIRIGLGRALNLDQSGPRMIEFRWMDLEALGQPPEGDGFPAGTFPWKILAELLESGREFSIDGGSSLLSHFSAPWRVSNSTRRRKPNRRQLCRRPTSAAT